MWLTSFPHLCFPRTFSDLLISLKNTLFLLPCLPFKINVGKRFPAIPPPRQSLCWDVGRKDKAFAWGPHYWQMLSATNKQVTGSVATRKDLSKERRVDVLYKPQ